METAVKIILTIVIVIGCITLSAVIYYGLAYALLWAVSQFVAIEMTKKMIVATAVILWVLSAIFGGKTVTTKKD